MPAGSTRHLLAAVILATAAAAHAQPSPAGMTLDQFLARQTGTIMAADSDGDGRVSRAEMDAMARNGRDPGRLFKLMDANGDGYIDGTELKAVLARRFQRMDRNGDGILAADERAAGRMAGQGQRQGRLQSAPMPDAASPQP